MRFDRIENALDALRKGEMILVADDESRENEGDLVCAAEKVIPEIINFMVTHGRGLVCLALDEETTHRLDLPLMVPQGSDFMGTAFTVSIDAHQRFGVTTGISAWDRATTIRVAIDEETRPADLRRPGHIFPLQARKGGIFTRPGHTEAAVDLASLAGLKPAGVIVEVLRADGFMARRPELEVFARAFDLRFITIADLMEYRLNQERPLVARRGA